MNEWIGEGRTAEDAVARGLAKLKLRQDQVDIQTLGETQSGLLSLFGYRRVKVRLVEKPRKGARFDRRLDDDRGDRRHERRDERSERRSDRREEKPRRTFGDERKRRDDRPRRDDPKAKNRPPREERRPVREAREPRKPAPPPPPRPEERRPPAALRPAVAPDVLLEQWKDLFGWDDLAWETKTEEGQRPLTLLTTSRADRIAGGGARGLEAFEYLFNLVASGGDREKPWVTFRLEGFPTAEEGRLTDKALYAAFQVRRTGKPFRLDPMPPAQRRLIHQALANHADVTTASEGDGPNRRVVVVPRGGTAAADPAGETPAPPAP